MDVDTIDIGVEFKHAIEAAVSSCDVLFVDDRPALADGSRQPRRTSPEPHGRLRAARGRDGARAQHPRRPRARRRRGHAGCGRPARDARSALHVRNAVEMADGPRWQYDVSRLMNLLERIRAGESHAEAAPPIEHGSARGAIVTSPTYERPAGVVPRHDDVTSSDRRPPDRPPRAPEMRSAARVDSAARPLPPSAGGLAGRGRTETAGGGHGVAGGRQRRRRHGSGGRRPGGLSDAPRWLLALAGLGVVAARSRWRSSVPTSSAMTDRRAARPRRPRPLRRHRREHPDRTPTPAATARQHRRARERRCRPVQALARHSQADPARIVQVREHRARRRRRDHQLRLQRSEARTHARAPRPLHRLRAPRADLQAPWPG